MGITFRGPIHPQPVLWSWSDAKIMCYDMANEQGAAVVIQAAGIGFRVIGAADAAIALDMAGDCPILHSEIRT